MKNEEEEGKDVKEEEEVLVMKRHEARCLHGLGKEEEEEEPKTQATGCELSHGATRRKGLVFYATLIMIKSLTSTHHRSKHRNRMALNTTMIRIKGYFTVQHRVFV